MKLCKKINRVGMKYFVHLYSSFFFSRHHYRSLSLSISISFSLTFFSVCVLVFLCLCVLLYLNWISITIIVHSTFLPVYCNFLLYLSNKWSLRIPFINFTLHFFDLFCAIPISLLCVWTCEWLFMVIGFGLQAAIIY